MFLKDTGKHRLVRHVMSYVPIVEAGVVSYGRVDGAHHLRLTRHH